REVGVPQLPDSRHERVEAGVIAGAQQRVAHRAEIRQKLSDVLELINRSPLVLVWCVFRLGIKRPEDLREHPHVTSQALAGLSAGALVVENPSFLELSPQGLPEKEDRVTQGGAKVGQRGSSNHTQFAVAEVGVGSGKVV